MDCSINLSINQDHFWLFHAPVIKYIKKISKKYYLCNGNHSPTIYSILIKLIINFFSDLSKRYNHSNFIHHNFGTPKIINYVYIEYK